jgi:hypothetical protein
MKTYGGVDVVIHVFLTSALLVRDLLASRPDRFIPAEKHLVSIGYGAGWAPEPACTTWNRETSCPYRDSNFDTRSSSQ